MIKYTEYIIGYREFPDEMSLLINISGCPNHCPGCHSKYLQEDIGEELNTDVNNHDSVEIIITGSTSYNEGIEYLVTFVDVNNEVNVLLIFFIKPHAIRANPFTMFVYDILLPVVMFSPTSA